MSQQHPCSTPGCLRAGVVRLSADTPLFCPACFLALNGRRQPVGVRGEGRA